MDSGTWTAVGVAIATLLLAIAVFASILQTRHMLRVAKRKDDLLTISRWADEGFDRLDETREVKLDGQDDAQYWLRRIAKLRALRSSVIRASSDFPMSFRSLVRHATDSLEEYASELERLVSVDDWRENDVLAIGLLIPECQESFVKLLTETGNLLAR